MIYDWAVGWEGTVVGPLFVTALLIFAVAIIAALILAPARGASMLVWVSVPSVKCSTSTGRSMRSTATSTSTGARHSTSARSSSDC